MGQKIKNKRPLVSIVIRGKNESRWLKILFRELKKQSYKNFEIIYCDNLSTDNSVNVAKRNHVNKILKISNYTPGKALNKGIKKSKGKYVIILSSHCIPSNNDWIKNYLDYMERNSYLVAVSGRQLPLPGTSTKDLLDLDIVFSNMNSIDQNKIYLNNANSIYRAKHLKKNLFDETLTNIEDREWALHQKKRKFKIGYLAKSEVFHIHGINQHESNSSRSLNTSKILLKKYLNYWNKCQFIKTNYFNYSILINARRKINKKLLVTKIKKIISQKFIKKLSLKNVIIITEHKLNFKFMNTEIKNFYPTVSLSNDLKEIYKKNIRYWDNVDYIISLNSTVNWSKNNLKKIINICIRNSCESVSIAEKIYGNFIVRFQDGGNINSLSLDRRENKPILNLMKWTEGCIFTPDNLRKGQYVNENTKLYFKE